MSVKVRVRITIEIPLRDTWGDDVCAKQVRDQAISGAEGALRRGLVVNFLQASPGSSDREVGTVIGEPEVIAVIAGLGAKR